MMVSIEQHVDWIGDCLAHLRDERLDVDRADAGGRGRLGAARQRLRRHHALPAANSWYMGANVPGQAARVPALRRRRRRLPRRPATRWSSADYLGFASTGPDGARCNDGVIRRLQPDVRMVLEHDGGARAAADRVAVGRRRAGVLLAQSTPTGRPGPTVGEVADGVLPGAAGPLAYRLYRPATPGPHPIVVYFHGGGWVLGSHDSDDPFCRDLCVRPARSSCRSTTGTRPRRGSPRRPTTGSPPCAGSRPTPPTLGGIPGQLAVCWLERGRQHRRRRLPAGARRRRARDRRSVAA